MTVGVSSNASTPKGSGTVKYSAQSANVSRTTKIKSRNHWNREKSTKIKLVF